MSRTTLSLFVVIVIVAPGVIAQRGAAALPTEVIHATEADLAARLKKDIEAQPDLSLTEVKNTTEYQINEVHRGKPAAAVTHADAHEMHYIMEGGGTLVTGGKLVKPATGGTIIEGGESRHVRKGDVIVIPKNTPHWYREVDGSIVYLEARFKAPTQ